MTETLSDKEQQRTILEISNRSARNLSLVLVIAMLVGDAGIGAMMLNMNGPLPISPPPSFILVSTLSEFIVTFIIAKLFLLRFILSSGKPDSGKPKLILSKEQAEFNFSPYLWKWFLIMSGIKLIAAAIIGILHIDSIGGGLGLGITIGSCFGATYYIVNRLVKSNDAVIE